LKEISDQTKKELILVPLKTLYKNSLATRWQKEASTVFSVHLAAFAIIMCTCVVIQSHIAHLE
jgi:hypothetical protein